MDRVGVCERCTGETVIRVRVALDEPGGIASHTGVPFVDHMLTAMAFHGGFGLEIEAQGDLEVDAHHLVEDVGICLGRALAEAVGKAEGIERFGQSSIPMDESLVTAIVDLSGRPFLRYDLAVPERQFGAFHTDLLLEFFRAFTINAGMTLHLRLDAGGNPHHVSEAAFKSLGRALRSAVALSGVEGVPSTKGRLRE